MDTAKLLDEGLVPSAGKRTQRPGLHALTGLRFLAALYVMMFHYGAGFTRRAHFPSHLSSFLERGNLGVVLFFMLSGFILLYSYKGNLQQGSDLYKFWVARIARLYPVYVLAIIIQGLETWSVPHGKEFLIFPMLQSWTLAVSPFGYAWLVQAWSISVEAFFYCCFPIILLLYKRRHPRVFLWSMAFVSFVVMVALQVPFAHPGLGDGWVATHFLLPVLALPGFFLGTLLGELFLDKKSTDPASTSNDWITVVGLIPAFVVISISADFYVLSVAAVWFIGWGIYRLADGKGPLTYLLSSRPLMLLGGASYSMYLLQSPVRKLLHRFFERVHPGLDTPLYPFVLIALCCLIFLYFEEPMRDLLRSALSPRRGVSKT
ncbi:acyltransferase [soil metagenome]